MPMKYVLFILIYLFLVSNLQAQNTCDNGSEARIRLCEGRTFQFGTQSINTGGIFTEIFTNQQGCDSIVQLSVTLIPIRFGDTVFIEQAIGTTYTFHGTIYDTAGIYTAHLTASTGCDSLVFLNLNFFDRCADAMEVLTEQSQPTCPTSEDGFIDILVTGGQAPYQYSIDGGANYQDTSFFSKLSVGNYPILVQDANACLSIIDTIHLVTTTQPFIDLGNDTIINKEATINLTIKSQNFEPTDFLWQSNQSINCITCPDLTIHPVQSDFYTLTAMDEKGCIARDTIFVDLISTPKIFIPNIFSPNGDGNNDIWRIEKSISATIQLKSMRIYDRWGNLVFQKQVTNSIDAIQWDGIFNGQFVPDGIYLYQLIVANETKQMKVLTGDITVIR